MLAREIIGGWRATHGQKWSDEELLAALNEALDEAALRRYPIRDGRTPEVCTVPVVAGEPLCPLHRKVLAPRVVLVRSTKRTLIKTVVESLSEQFGVWEEQVGEVSRYISDHTSGFLRLYKIPAVDDQLSLIVDRLPLVALKMDDEPELHDRLHYKLQSWLTYRAYMKHGADTYDPPRAMEGLALFEQEFGPPRIA